MGRQQMDAIIDGIKSRYSKEKIAAMTQQELQSEVMNEIMNEKAKRALNSQQSQEALRPTNTEMREE